MVRTQPFKNPNPPNDPINKRFVVGRVIELLVPTDPPFEATATLLALYENEILFAEVVAVTVFCAN